MKKCEKHDLPGWRAREVFPIKLLKDGSFELYTRDSKIEVDPKKLWKFPIGPETRICPKCIKSVELSDVAPGNRVITHNRRTLAG